MKFQSTIFALALLVVGTSYAEKTPFWGATAPVAFDTPVSMLKNGEFTWDPEIAPAGPITVLVSLDEQRAYTYRNGILIGATTVSTGKPGHETPTGVFTTKMKDKNHHSSTYHNAAMPYTERLTNDGVALHAGGIPGYPESHGCVHMPSEYARLLFAVAPLGMTVVIADHKTAPEIVDHPPFLAPITDKGDLVENMQIFAGETYRWEPEKSPDGPASMVISRHDRRIVVLRNGTEIGRARIEVKDPATPIGTHVLVARQTDSGQPEWIRVGMVGHMDDAKTAPDPDAVERIVMPHTFRQLVTPLIAPGTTLMMTDAPILEHTTGKEMAVISSNPES